VQKKVALERIRIKHRWQAIDQENEAIEKKKKKFEPYALTNKILLSN
jgi:hypothetical protein